MYTRARKISPHHPPPDTSIRPLFTLNPPRTAISNRSDPRLEMPESYTKQRTDPLSNRHKFTHPTVRPCFASLPARLRLRSLATALPIPAPHPIGHAPSGHPVPFDAFVRISNRHLVRLECDVNTRKQKEGTDSNRH